MPTNPERITALALSGVILSLLAVGVVSGTLVRHLVQVVPPCLALALVLRRVPWARYAALPIFAIWLLIMIVIWLYLLGIARIVTGTFTPAEIALTLVIGASCLAGGSQAFRKASPVSIIARIAWAAVFTGLQFAALWASMRPAIADI